jgi:hypothetical protein
MLAFLVVAGVQGVRGYLDGFGASVTGYELRVLVGWATFLVAIPIVADPVARERLVKGLLLLGLAVGVWGLLQYFTNIGLSAGSDSGVRSGATVTNLGPAYTSSRSIQGGLFAFPLAFLMGLAVLVLTRIRSTPVRAAVVVMVVLNAACLLLTYERTFWLGTAVAFGLIAIRADWGQRVKGVLLVAAVLAVSLPALATLSPGSLQAARERLLSLGQVSNDRSVRSRLAETRPMLVKIREHPVAGWGLGDNIVWGQPWAQVSAKPTPFAHNGFLWLSWKLGIPAAILLCALMGWSVVARGPPGLPPLERAVRHGAQAGLFVMLVVSITFPSVRQLSITAVLGVLLALCLAIPRTAVSPGRVA